MAVANSKASSNVEAGNRGVRRGRLDSDAPAALVAAAFLVLFLAATFLAEAFFVLFLAGDGAVVLIARPDP